MKRLILTLLLVLGLLGSVWAAPLTPELRARTIAYVQSCQNADGGFRGNTAPGGGSLGATNSALRALKYFEGEIQNRRHVGLFILSCIDPETGGFSDLPAGKPDVRSTAMGLMALAELKQARGSRAERAVQYLSKNAASLPDIYIAAAALDAAGLPAPEPSRWVAAWEATRNPDGTYGKGAADTASAAITLLRLGAAPSNRDAAARALRAAQGADGGFPGAEGKSDMGSTYRMMRALYMLKEKPDLARLRQFIASCRNEDGGYGAAPGQPSALSPTYFATIVLHWADTLETK